MKVLMIGGTGLISTHLTQLLLERGDEVTLYNRGKTDAPLPVSAKHIQGDRKDFATFERQLQAAGSFDCVIDMVCFAPDEAESLVRAVRGRAEQLIFCSTVDVYRKPAGRYPVLESEPRRPSETFPYAYQKARCEMVLEDAQARGDVTLTILRPAYTYGEGRGILHTFGFSTSYLDRMRKGKPIIVHGNGQSFWSCAHARDVARTFVAAAGNPVAYGKAYHLAGEEWLTWNRYHQGVAEALEVDMPPLVHIPTDLLVKVAPERAFLSKENFQFNNIFDSAAAKRDLHFQYTTPWVEGVRQTVAWLDAHGQVKSSDDDPFEDALISAWQAMSERVAVQLRLEDVPA